MQRCPCLTQSPCACPFTPSPLSTSNVTGPWAAVDPFDAVAGGGRARPRAPHPPVDLRPPDSAGVAESQGPVKLVGLQPGGVEGGRVVEVLLG